MADFSTLIASIEATIKENGVQAITGQVLQDELLLMVNAINQLKQDTLEGYAFYGEPLPNGATRVVTQNTFFLASAGTYTINGSTITISDAGVSVIVYDCVNDEITTYQLFAYDANPTSGSGNAVTSGGVKSALDTKADKNGASPDLFAGFAGNLVDTRSAGTPQGPYAFRQSGGDGVDYMVRIKGKTEAFNQLVAIPGSSQSKTQNGVTFVDNRDGSYTISTAEGGATQDEYLALTSPTIEGHKYLLIGCPKGGSTSTYYLRYYRAGRDIGDGSIFDSINEAATGYPRISVISGTIISTPITFRPQLIDLTLMFGAGNEPSSVAEFEALHPLPYYNYNAGVLKNNAATGIKTRGFNQWDEQWELGAYDTTTGAKTDNATVMRCKNKIPVFPNTVYYFKIPNGIRYFEYDASGGYLGVNTAMAASNTFTTGANTRFITFHVASTIVYRNDICINLSDASRNGIYEPYWERALALGLNSIPCHDENNNAVVVNGLDGVGTSYDEGVVENGYVTKINKRRKRVNLGDLNWLKDTSGGNWAFYTNDLNGQIVGSSTVGVVTNNICARYTTIDVNTSYNKDKSLFVKTSGQTFIIDTAYNDADAFAAAMNGIYLDYELATPKVLTVDNPIPALIEVDNLGTEKRLPEDTADNPQAPFESDSNYSVSVANLVRLLNS